MRRLLYLATVQAFLHFGVKWAGDRGDIRATGRALSMAVVIASSSVDTTCWRDPLLYAQAWDMSLSKLLKSISTTT